MIRIKLKEARKRRNMTQCQLADATGIRQALISRMESGQTMPKVDQLNAFMKALRAGWKDLVEDAE